MERLEDIRVACLAVERHLQRGGASDELIFDAIRVRLIEIGEAVKDLDAETTALEPEIPWADISRMRDVLAHRYFDTTHSIVTATAQDDVPRLLAAVQRMLRLIALERETSRSTIRSSPELRTGLS